MRLYTGSKRTRRRWLAMARERIYLDCPQALITSERVRFGRKAYATCEISSASIVERTPKGRSGCLMWLGGITLGAGAAMVEITLNGAIITGVIGALIMLAGTLMPDPKTVYRLLLATTGRESTVLTTRDKELVYKAAKALRKATASQAD